VPQGARSRRRARALRHAFRSHRRRQDLPASVRRPHVEFRREACAPCLRGGRPDRSRHAARAVPAQRARPDPVLRRVDGAGPDPRRRRSGARRHRAGNGNRRSRRFPRQGHHLCDRRCRPHLPLLDQRLHQHRRRPRHGGACRHRPRGHGVLAVPPDRRGRRRRADHRRRAWRRRDSAQLVERALHGALCAERQGSGFARRRFARHGH